MSTPIAYHVVRQRLSTERFAPYETACGGDLARAFALYEWNMEVSSAMFHAIGMLEVVLRNALNDQLTAAHAGVAWYRAIAPLFDLKAQEDINKAIAWATDWGKRPEIVGGVVAQLTFGFWRFLLAKRYHTSLWVPLLHRAFPSHADAARNRSDLEDRLERLHFLRNRVAHHEPIHRRNLRRDYTRLLEVAGWICPDTKVWIDGCSTVRQVLDRRP